MTGESVPIVEVQTVSKHFGKVVALQDINLSVFRGEFLTLLGPSGCGKTTLLRIIAGFESPSSGRIFINGKDVTDLPPERRPLNMVFQRYALFPHLTVFENVAFGLRMKRIPEKEIRLRVVQMLALVGLEGFESRMPHQLSGGQCQRVALVRALVNQPEVLLLDEPLSALDRKIRQQMQGELRALQARLGTTFVYVTHDQEEAMAMSSRIVLMRDGRIVQIATPQELYHCPNSAFAADFVGDTNILEAEIVLDQEKPVVRWHGLVLKDKNVPGDQIGRKVRVLVRPESFRIFEQPPANLHHVVPAEVLRSTYCGFYWMHQLQIKDALILVRELGGEMGQRQPGSTCFVSVDPSRVILLTD